MTTTDPDFGIEEPNLLLLEQLTWPEIELALTRGTRTVIIPVGSVEQHGPHLPLMVDAERGTALGLRVARNLGDAFVAPTVRVGCSEHHMGFAGTITLRPSTLEALLTDYCVSLARHGFERLCLLPSHGGNFEPIEDMTPRLQAAVDEAGSEARVVAFTDLLGIVGVWRWMVEEELGMGDRVGGHADIAESSEFLFLHPGLVRVGREEAGSSLELTEDVLEQIFEKGFRAITSNGILGDARGMDPEMGEKLLDGTARTISEYFKGESDG